MPLYRTTRSFYDGKQCFGNGELTTGEGIPPRYFTNGFLVPMEPLEEPQPACPEPPAPEEPAKEPAAAAPCDGSCGDCLPLPPLEEVVDNRSIPILAERGIHSTADFRAALRDGSDAVLGVPYLNAPRLATARAKLGLED